jgi:hypothetical protein
MGRFFICASSLSGCALSVFFSLIHFRMARVRRSLVLGYCNFSLFAIAAGLLLARLASLLPYACPNPSVQSHHPLPGVQTCALLPQRVSPPFRSLRELGCVPHSGVSRLLPPAFFAASFLLTFIATHSFPGFASSLTPPSATGNDTLHRSAPESCAFVFLNRCTSQLPLKSTEPGVLGLCARHCESDGKANGRGKGTVFAAKPSSKRQK